MSDSPSFTDVDENGAESEEGARYGLNLLLFGLTVLSVFWTGAAQIPGFEPFNPRYLLQIWRGWPFAVPLLAILVAHESGHYIAARIHRVPASLPYFIPLPVLSPFGTMGAIIGMSGRIRSRVALLDIGAAGPLAGMLVALPVLAIGLSQSPIAQNPEHYTLEGQSLLYALMKRLFAGPIPEGADVQIGPTAMAGWVGLLITMINLLPWGQLDGGHIAYALFGERQHAMARWVRRALLLFFAYNVLKFAVPVLLKRSLLAPEYVFGNTIFWLVWYGFTGLIARMSGGADHPPFEVGELGRGRRAIAWLCLILFVLLFMPTPQAQY